MAKNPMQRKAQNSFLLGMLITLLLTGIVIAFLVLQLTKITKEQKQSQADKVTVCVLKTDVKSGQVITDDMVKTLSVDKNTIPKDSFGKEVSNVKTYRLKDILGNSVVTDSEGNLCLPYIDKETGEAVIDEETGLARYRIIETTDKINYYYQDTREKVELSTVPIVAKVDMAKNTVITTSTVTKSNQQITDDLRQMEYNMFMLPSHLENGEYVDIRLRLPNGKDYIVVSHKEVSIPEVDGAPSLTTVSLNMSEVEILTLSCAIVESYKIEGSIIYVNRYIEPGMQSAATATYIPDDDTINLINRDPNCVLEAKQALFQRNNDAAYKAAVRNPINNGLNENSENSTDNAVQGLEQEIRASQEERQKYLESLGGTY